MIPLSGSSQPGTSLYCECKTTDTGLVHRVVGLFTSQLSLVLIFSIPKGWQAELTWTVD